MILTVDIGNTNISMGSFSGDKLVSHFCVNGDRLMHQRVPFPFNQPALDQMQKIVVASVNPKFESVLNKHLNTGNTGKILVIGKDIPLKLAVLVDKPEKVGIDRLLNAFAAFKQTKTSTTVVDFGTAITFDIVSKKGAFLGGLIIPGVGTSANALYSRTAFLPKVDIKKPDNIIGKNTDSAIRSGIYHATVGAVSYILKEIERELGCVQSVIATGGDAKMFMERLPQVNTFMPHLTLDGIRLAFEES